MLHNLPKIGRLETIGYTEQDAQRRIDAFLALPDSILMDIRSRPHSRWRPAFRQRALIERYGVQYCHRKELGNINYNQPGVSIVLAAPDEGVRQVLSLLLDGRSLLLLCACQDYERCHRKTVYDLIVSALTTAEVQ